MGRCAGFSHSVGVVFGEIRELFNDLIDAFSGLIKGRQLEEIKRIVVERVRVIDKISHILEKLRDQESVEFASLFGENLTRNELVVTFLALLELIRLQVIKELPAGFRLPGRQQVSEQLLYSVLASFLTALMQTGVAICGGGVVKPLAGRTEGAGAR